MAATGTAQEALDLVGRDPHEALEVADAIVTAFPRPRTPEAIREVATAHRAAGLALRSLGDPSTAAARMRRGISTAERGGLHDVAAEVRMSTAFVLLDLGRQRAALASVDQALAVLRGVRAARARVIRALVLQRSGRMREAMDEYAEALPVLRRAGDRDWEARLRHNRALLSIELGETRAAITDLEWTRDHDLAAGHHVDAADALFNIGVALEAAGDIPGALATFDRAELEWGGIERPERWSARVDAYLRVGLVDEARHNARAAVEWLSRHDWPGLEAQARLRLAQCLLAEPDSDPAEAATHADRARILFGAQGRHEGRDRADYFLLRCALALEPTSRDLDAVADVCARLRATGGDVEAAELRTIAGEVALSRSDVRRAQALLGPLAAMATSRSPEIRSRAALARALLAEAQGDGDTARRDLAAAWTAIERQRSLLGAAELRATSGTHADDVVARGARLALSDGSAATAFEWMERSRAAALRHRPVTPPLDPELARALARLRTSSLAESESVLDGEWSPSLERDRARHEREVVRLARARAGSGATHSPARVAEVRRLLGADETFAHLLIDEGRIRAVVVSARRARLLDLAPAPSVLAEAETVTFALRRLVSSFGPPGRGDAVTAALASSAARLDQLLAAPLLEGRAGPVVICPPTRLASLPWGVLPSLVQRSVTVAPSARAWVAARGARPAPGGGTLAVAGPGLPGATQEVEAIAALDDRSRALTGPDATVEAVLGSLPGRRALHVAAHGRLRQDNALFSALELADGPLTGFDLDLAQVPDTVVLSGCSSGRTQRLGSEEPLGFAWTLLGLGARRVIAPLLPVPDGRTAPLMVQLHRDLAAEAGAGAALAAARSRPDGAATEAWVAASFVAFGH